MVKGRAMMSPMNPRMLPHTESANRIIAGFNPITLPIIFGVSTKSWMHCTTTYTAIDSQKISQKPPPVPAA